MGRVKAGNLSNAPYLIWLKLIEGLAHILIIDQSNHVYEWRDDDWTTELDPLEFARSYPEILEMEIDCE